MVSDTLQNSVCLTPQEHRLLGMGRIEVSDWMNAFPGTDCAALFLMEQRGLLSYQRYQDRMGSRYTVTPRGRDLYVSYGRPYVPITDEAFA